MAVQNPFFGRRDPEPLQPRTGSTLVPGSLGSTTPGVPAGSSSSSAAAGASSTQPPGRPAAQQAQTESSGSKLTVGPNIKLKGVEITDCDTLVVEGTVEATMDSRVIQIAQQGAFRGSADIDIAEIHGEFNGTLNVREKLVIFSTGKVTGKICYGKLVVEEGGQLSGEIEMGVGKNMPRAAQAAPAPAPASASVSPTGNPAAPQAEPRTGEGDSSASHAAATATATA